MARTGYALQVESLRGQQTLRQLKIYPPLTALVIHS